MRALGRSRITGGPALPCLVGLWQGALLGREPQVPVNSLLGLAKKLAGAADARLKGKLQRAMAQVLAIACALVLLSWDTAKMLG